MSRIHEQDVFREADEFDFADYGIVFGCDFASEMQFRIAGAIQLIQEVKVGALILSGGKTTDSEHSEAEMMESAALRAGVNRERLILESKSRTTQQNVLFCKALLQQRGHELDGLSIALITSDWHMSRAWMIARRHFPKSVSLLCSPQRTTCNHSDWTETIQCACLIRSELVRVKNAMQHGYPSPCN